MSDISPEDRARRVKVLLYDVLTNGDITIMPLWTAAPMAHATEILAAEHCTLDEIAYVGDDIIDLPVMRKVGFAIATANARVQVKAAAHYITPNPGGQGADRDAIDFILNARGILDQTIEQYLDPNSAEAKRADIGVGNM